jgi:nicotinate-nucleotide adenylyltransferase
MKIGIFGGTFNPPHIGHLILAENAVKLLKLDKLIFVPAFNPPHKMRNKIISAYHRLKMLQLCIKNKKYFETSDIEIMRRGTSYTIETLKIMKDKYPEAKFFLLVGYDNYIEFHLWKDYEKIFQLCTVVIFKRTIQDIKHEIDYILPAIHNVKYLNTPLLDISSTEIRKRIKKNKSIDYYVTREVKKYIKNNKLYQ